MNNLYVVATPIGNIEDLSKRAIKTLETCPTILCEDTKHSGLLLSKLGIKSKLISLHKHNESNKKEWILEILKEGDVALISDAGTPTISDPGQELISFLKENGVNVIPIPGPSAVITALSASGLSFKTFTFVGFLEKTEKKIIDTIKDNSHSDISIYYESPNRINKTLKFILDNFGDIEVVVARELTKMYEEIIKDKVSNLVEKEFKGEIVLIVSNKQIIKETKLATIIKSLKKEGLTDRSIINVIKELEGFNKNEAYSILKEEGKDE